MMIRVLIFIILGRSLHLDRSPISHMKLGINIISRKNPKTWSDKGKTWPLPVFLNPLT